MNNDWKGTVTIQSLLFIASGQSYTLFTSQLFSSQKECKGRREEWFSSLPVQFVFVFFLFLNKKPYSDFRKQFMNVELFVGIIVSLGCDFLFFQPSGLFNAYSLSQFLLSLPEGNLQISSMPSAGLAWKIFHSTVRDFTWTLTAGQSGSIARITANETQVRAFWWSGSRMGYMHTIPWHL